MIGPFIYNWYGTKKSYCSVFNKMPQIILFPKTDIAHTDRQIPKKIECQRHIYDGDMMTRMWSSKPMTCLCSAQLIPSFRLNQNVPEIPNINLCVL